MIRLLLLLLGTLTTAKRDQWGGAAYQAPVLDGGADPGGPAPAGPAPDGPAGPGAGPPRPVYQYSGGPGGRWTQPGPPRRRLRPWVKWAVGLAVLGVIFRRAIASVVLVALSAALHFVGLNVHLPHIRLGWPWQTISAGTTTNTDLGPWVLQKLEGISRPALGQANFNFYFTHKVSKSIGPWPCWYASTFYAVGHASATVDLNPGPSWWAPATSHYRLQVLSRPQRGKPGHVSVTMMLPRPQLPQSAHQVTIDNLPSKPIDSQHSWTYPGFGCGCAAQAPVRTVGALRTGADNCLLQGHPFQRGDRAPHQDR